jgi:N-acyl-D-amino-acid deacylase
MTPDRLIVSGATVVDGAGGPAFAGSVVVEGERIAAVLRGGHFPAESGARVVEAEGRVLSPGFVDAHNHSDVVPFVEPWMDSAVRQGCTTLVVGNCGSSPWPPAGAAELATLAGVRPEDVDATWSSFGDYLARIDDARPAVNVAALVGHGALRAEVLGWDRRSPSADELARMRRMASEAMAGGAVGLSTGLIYAPGMYAATDEVVALASEARRFDGVYASHIRGEGEPLFDAIGEAIEIGRRARVPAHVSHLKCETELVWGRAAEVLALLREGDDVTADQYPYTAWSSILSSLLPPWAPIGELRSIASDRRRRERLVGAVENGEPGFQSSVKGVGWHRIVIESSSEPRWNGRSIADIARERAMAPVDAALELLVEDPDTAVIGHAMHEDDVRTILADADVMVASDASAMSPGGPLGGAPVHPRNYGTFPRVLGEYVRAGVLSLEVAVRKMTSLPAERFRLGGRGRIAEGALADLVVFDPDRVRDRAVFGAPHAYPDGVDLVVVNGRVAWDGERRERAGRVLTGSAARS